MFEGDCLGCNTGLMRRNETVCLKQSDGMWFDLGNKDSQRWRWDENDVLNEILHYQQQSHPHMLEHMRSLSRFHTNNSHTWI